MYHPQCYTWSESQDKMDVPSLNFCYGGGLQQSYHHQPPTPLFPCNLPLPQPLFNSNPWTAQCMSPPVHYYQQQQQQFPATTSFMHQSPKRGHGRNWHRQNHNKFKRRDNNDMGTITKDYHCEVCECSFRTEFDLNGHISQHRQCTHPGCDFMATNRVLKDHEMVHRIPKELLFTSEEEIAKWREERRKRYPTNARVREKLLEEEAKIQRGETAKDDVHRYCKRGGADYGYSGAKRGRGGRGRYQRRHFRQDGRRDEKLAHRSESLDDNNDCPLDQLASSLAKDTGITGCSSPQKTKAPILHNIPRHKATLLEKLLAPEIRQERNTILQCIRHIVKKNFFDIEQEHTSNVETNSAVGDAVEDVSSEGNTGDKHLERFSNSEAEVQVLCSSDTIADNLHIN